MSTNVLNKEERSALANRIGLVKKRKAEPEAPRISAPVCTHWFRATFVTNALSLGQAIGTTTINPHEWHLRSSPYSTRLFSILSLATREQAQAPGRVGSHELHEQEVQGLSA